MKRQLGCGALLAFLTTAAQAAPTAELMATDLRAEYRTTPLGMDETTPRLSWILTPVGDRTPARGQRQRAYQLLAASSEDILRADRGDLWDSGRKISGDTLGIVYAGKPLHARQRVHWKVRVWDGTGAASPWSAPTWFELGLLTPDDWKASWIDDAPPTPQSDEQLLGLNPAPLFRNELRLDPAKKIARARVYVTGLGYYELTINGQRIGDQVLDPGWTSFRKRVLYTTHDVTTALNGERNAIGLTIGNGWWNPLPLRLFGRFNFRDVLAVGPPRALLQLEVEYTDGTRTILVTDTSWKTAPSPILRNSVYLGEVYDARKEIPGWDRPGFDDRHWKPAQLAKEPVGPLFARTQPPIRITRTVKPVALTQPKPGMWVFDLGQNFAGWARLRVQGPKGTRISMRFSELLYPDGTPNGMTTFAGQIKQWNDNDRLAPRPEDGGAPKTAWQQQIYILKGGGVEEYTPRFSFHGFRYVTVEGFPGTPTPDAIVGLRLNADVPVAGAFTSSDAMLNRLFEVIDWTLLSNLFSIQSDCPGREKLGYGGDIVGASEFAILTHDMNRFYAKVVRDFADDVREGGALPETAPFVGIASDGFTNVHGGSIGWGAAHPVLLGNLRQYYGDRRLMEEQYDTLRRWIDFLATNIPDLITANDISDHEMVGPKPKEVTGTAMFHFVVSRFGDYAALLGKTADVARARALAARISAAFNQRFFDPRTGRVGTGSQTEQVYALYLGLLPEAQRAKALEALTNTITDKNDSHLTTGIFGNKYLLDVLTRSGRADLATRIARQKTYPGWGYMLENGATTLWEQWGIDEKGGSHNHPMFGAVSEWMMKHVLGIAPDPRALGFDRIAIMPAATREFAFARGHHDSVRGRIAVDWKRDSRGLTLDATIPWGTLATIAVPTSDEHTVSEGERPAAQAPGVKFLRREGSSALFEVGGGHYVFHAP